MKASSKLGHFLAITIALSLAIMSMGCPNPTMGPKPNANVEADPSLAPYVCTKNIASSPGNLTLLPKLSAGSPQTRAYAEYVPPNYSSAQKWPCIINLHGDGEIGDGSSQAVMQAFKYYCLPGMINNGTWDSQKRFVVLSPQFSSYDDRSAINVKTFIQYAKANYNIDVKRIYLTAVSGGGVALGNYLDTYSGGEAAAALPVSCYVPSNPAKWKQVPVYFLCGAADTTVNPANIISNYNALIAANPPPPVLPKITLYTGVKHEAASANLSYAPSLMTNQFETSYSGVNLIPYTNVYNWLLQYHR